MTKEKQVSAPDYSKWVIAESYKNSYVHGGKDVDLKITTYLDQTATRTVNILENEEGKPWLMFYEEMVAPGRIASSLIFECVNDSWILIADLSDSIDIEQETDNLMNEKYALRFRD